MKKKLALILALSAALLMTACGSSEEVDTTSSAAPAAESAAEAPAAEAEATDAGDDELQAALDELATALDGTCWVGMDAEDYTTYAMAFDGAELAIANSEDGSSIEGYWGIGTDAIYVYEDEAMTTELATMPWSYDEENEVMVLNDRAVLAQVEGGDLEAAVTAMQQYAVAAQIAEALNGTVWAGLDENATTVMALALNGTDCYFGLADAEGNTAEVEGQWSMDYDNLYIYNSDDTLALTLGWDFSDDLLVLTDESGVSAYLAQSDAGSIGDAIAALAETL